MRISLLALTFPLMMAAQNVTQPLPAVDQVVAKMVEQDVKRQTAFHGYTAARRYILENQHHHKRAEMLVKTTCREDGSKQFEIVSESGWGGARKYVFRSLLKSEAAASEPEQRERSRITPANYSFEMVGAEHIEGRLTYRLAIAPKTVNQYLMQGTIWVDASDYAIVRIEGTPSKSPSFWIKHVHFVHTYEKNGPFWLPVSDRSVTDARIFGSTELTIEYLDYSLNSLLSASSSTPQTRASQTGN